VEAALASYPGIVLAGAGYRGIGLPDCIRQGLAAAAVVVGRGSQIYPPDRHARMD
jgi:oxygen-dependent protoporphyrinogen oxidase